jgi:hypothetical protein
VGSFLKGEGGPLPEIDDDVAVLGGGAGMFVDMGHHDFSNDYRGGHFAFPVTGKGGEISVHGVTQAPLCLRQGAHAACIDHLNWPIIDFLTSRAGSLSLPITRGNFSWFHVY